MNRLPASPSPHTHPWRVRIETAEWWPAVFGFLGFAAAGNAWAGPEGMAVAAGSASVAHHSAVTTISVSDRAILNWASFNVAAGETARFVQPSPVSIVWNQISSANPSQIFGSIEANGIVILANEAGFWFGPNSVVRAGGFMATTAGGPPAGFMAGGAWGIQTAPPLASIVNYGRIEAAAGGSVFLVAEKIENHGVLTAPDGTIGLYAGKEVLVSERPDGRGLAARVALPAGSVDNLGRLVADAGRVALHAKVVNQGGVISANSVREVPGGVELFATDAINIAPGSVISAKGDPAANSPGGSVVVHSNGTYSDHPSALVDVSGGGRGGNAGSVEVCADRMSGVSSQMLAGAAPGYLAGGLLIDPSSITIADNGTGSPGNGTILPGSPPTTLTLSPASLNSFANITLRSTGTIDVNAAWTLPDRGPATSSLLLQAATDIRFGQTAFIKAGTGWSITLAAGNTVADPSVVKPGTGSILLNGGSGIYGIDKAVTLNAGKDVTVNRGAVRTTGGGSISVLAAGGSINTGQSAAGYRFSAAGYVVSPELGGISTAAGGDVSLVAGQNITAFLPNGISSNHQDAGSGAFGPDPGNVTVTAGQNIFGHFVVANGQGKISAGRAAGDSSRPLALSLVSGKWDVSADSISLQEVRNPNGVFNAVGSGSPPPPNRFLFDYADSASVSLAARNSILLGAGAPPRIPNAPVPSIFPPSLSMSAGAGGISIAQAFSLFPSASGQLAITTLEGGSLSGGGIFMSDTRERQWTQNSGRFTDDGSFAPPGHLADMAPALLDISGSIRSFNLTLPKPADVRVGGDVADSSFRIQNLRPTDTTRFTVAGSVSYRSEYSFFKLPEGVSDANLPQLKNAVNGLVSTPDLRYDAASRMVSIRGRMTQEQADGLANLVTYTFGPGGTDPLIGPNGEPITTTVRVLPDDVIGQLFAVSQGSFNGTFPGFQIGGPGLARFDVGSMDLGSSRGIDSFGPGLNRALGSVASRGADVLINTRDDLVMFSSAIRSRAGGAISIDSGGRIEVGSKLVVAESDVARGIYSTAGSPVTVTSTGNLDVNGSRIATFDGGRVSVLSRHGNVDAGSGGLAVQAVNQIVVAPDGSVSEESSTIPGSGILTATFRSGTARVGDIAVNAPRGDVLARQGGIIQMPFNGTPYGDASVKVNAGTRAPDNTVLYQGSIDATGSGVIGGNVALDATGPVLGVVLASGNINIVTPQNVNVTALAQGNVSIGAGGTVSGTVVGVGGISASGTSISASLLSQNVSSSGGTSGQVGLAAANVAGATAAAAAGTASTTAAAATTPKPEAKDEEKTRGNRRLLARTVGRVTVSLPKSP